MKLSQVPFFRPMIPEIKKAYYRYTWPGQIASLRQMVASLKRTLEEQDATLVLQHEREAMFTRDLECIQAIVSGNLSRLRKK